MDHEEFIRAAQGAATNAGHIFPEYAACEAALESAFGRSKLALQANNLFGQKKGIYTAQYPTISINTWEVIDGKNVTVPAEWVVFPDWDTCFKERMALLKRKSCYSEAVNAPDGESFVRLVSAHWSTDPQRAEKVLQMYKAHEDLFV